MDDDARPAPTALESLADEDLRSPATPQTLAPSLDVGRAYDPTRAREHMRGAIAIVLLSILGAVVLFAFVGIWTARVAIEDMRVVLEILFAPLVGLVGAVTGFYYGSRARLD